MKYASKKTNLNDYGTLDFKENYAVIFNTNSHLNCMKNISNLGYISARIELNMTMVRRLQIINYLKENPEVLKVPVRSPVFVLGYQISDIA